MSAWEPALAWYQVRLLAVPPEPGETFFYASAERAHVPAAERMIRSLAEMLMDLMVMPVSSRPVLIFFSLCWLM